MWSRSLRSTICGYTNVHTYLDFTSSSVPVSSVPAGAALELFAVVVAAPVVLVAAPVAAHCQILSDFDSVKPSFWAFYEWSCKARSQGTYDSKKIMNLLKKLR